MWTSWSVCSLYKSGAWLSRLAAKRTVQSLYTAEAYSAVSILGHWDGSLSCRGTCRALEAFRRCVGGEGSAFEACSKHARRQVGDTRLGRWCRRRCRRMPFWEVGRD